jgi:hypothetical protein
MKIEPVPVMMAASYKYKGCDIQKQVRSLPQKNRLPLALADAASQLLDPATKR